MLDLGSNVNILPKKTWEALGKPEADIFPNSVKNGETNIISSP
jgi:hypothetical protein